MAIVAGVDKNMLKDEDVKKYLSSMDEKKLASFLQEIFTNRKSKKEYDNGDFQIDDLMCLAICSYGSNDGVVDKEAIKEFYASPLLDEAAEEDSLCEQGKCTNCDTEVISFAKIAVCPICNTKIFLT